MVSCSHLFGIIGGLTVFFGVKYEDREMADNLLIFGIVWTVILIIIYFASLGIMLINS